MRLYFHISREKLPLNTALTSKGVPRIGDEIEQLLESHRPADKISRSSAIYMLDHQDFSKCGVPYSQGYVHIVEPNGALLKLDAHWIGRIQHRKLMKVMAPTAFLTYRDLPDEDLAVGYWSGKSSTKPSWEYLAEGAVVVGYASEELVPTGR